MKWLIALTAVTLAFPTWARGLKTAREPENGAVRSKELEAENEALRKRVSDLESMMQMARAEVQRMDAEKGAHHKRRRESCGDGDPDVLKQEIEDMKQKIRAADADKNDLVQSLRHMMSNNATQMFQRQAERSAQEAQTAREIKMAFELKCGKEKQALEAQLQATSGKCDNAKEVAQQLQEDNANLQQQLSDAHALLAKNSKVNKELLSDKKNLVTTTQQLMRQNSKLKHTLEKETADKTKQAAELVAAKASIAKLSKMELSSAAKKQVKTALKAFPGHHHQHLSEKDKAHMRDMDKYIDSAESEGDELVESQLRAVRQEDELLKKGKVGTHLTDWLGLKASPKPAAAAPESSPTIVKAPAKKASADDSAEAEAEDLVVQAKSQLAAMEHEDAES